MQDVAVDWLANETGGHLLNPGQAPSNFKTLVPSIDSRHVGQNSIFFAISGERVDGGDFVEDVIARGAAAVVCTGVHAMRAHSAQPLCATAIIQHDDPAEALGNLASAWLAKSGCKVIGVTGSVGKTSTKDLLRALLGTQVRVFASKANFNTEIGLPLSVLSAPADTEVMVLEMGMRGSGQIAQLATIANPEVGIVTNVFPVHLELLGSIENIAKAKAELVEGLVDGGVAVIPNDNPILAEAAACRETIKFDPSKAGIAAAEQSLRDFGCSFSVEPTPTSKRNLPAALAGCAALGIQPSGVAELEASPLRGQTVVDQNGATWIFDCYNASPESVRAALEDLVAQPANRHIALLGDMLELGPKVSEFHSEIGEVASKLGVAKLFAVGAYALDYVSGFNGEASTFINADDAANQVPSNVRAGDLILVKASRGVGLERILDKLQLANANGEPDLKRTEI